MPVSAFRCVLTLTLLASLTAGGAESQPTTSPQADLNSLIQQIRSKDSATRHDAAVQLGYLGQAAAPALPALLEAYASDRMWNVMKDDAPVWPEEWAIKRIGIASPGALAEQIKSSNPEISLVAATFAKSVGGPEVYAALLKAIQSPHRETQRNAIWALGGFPASQSLDPLLDLFESKDPSVRADAILALADFYVPPTPDQTLPKAKIDPRARKAFLAALKDPSWDAQRYAAEAAGRLGCKEAKGPLLAMLAEDDGRNKLSSEAMRGLAYLRATEATPLIVSRLHSPDGVVRDDVITALGIMKDPQAVDALISAAESKGNSWRRGLAIRSLGQIGGDKAYGAVVRALQSPELDIRRFAAIALGEMGHPEISETLSTIAKDTNEEPVVRADAAEALGKLGGPDASDILQKLLGPENSPAVRERAAKGLGHLHDPKAIPALIDAIPSLDQTDPDRPWLHQRSNYALEALREISGQTFSTQQQWRDWWDKQEKQASR